MKIKAITQSDHYMNGEPQTNIFEFTKQVWTEGYGNKTYIQVDKDGEDWKYIDARYISIKDFKTVCLDILEDYYGENLKSTEILED